MIVTGAVQGYWLGRFIAADAEESPNNLHQLAKPLQRVIEILLEDGSLSGVLDALTPPPVNLERMDEQDLVAPWHKYVDLLNCLLAINRALPGKNPAHRLAKTGDLYELIDELADYWESATGAHFTPKWHRTGGKLQAATNAAAFVFEVVRYVDRYALPSPVRGAAAAARRLRNSRKKPLQTDFRELLPLSFAERRSTLRLVVAR